MKQLLLITILSLIPLPTMAFDGKSEGIHCAKSDRYTDRIPSDKISWERVFNSCLDKMAKARSGHTYQTKHDENLERIVDSCKMSAYEVSGMLIEKRCKKYAKDEE